MTAKEKGIVHVSEMTGKLEGIASINTNSLSNAFCQKMAQNSNFVCSRCYANERLSTYRKNCVTSFQWNSEILSTKLLTETDEALPDLRGFHLVRFNSFGELINDTHMLNILTISRVNPDKVLSLYTKRHDLVRKYVNEIPSNLVLVSSNPYMDDLATDVPAMYDALFCVYTKPFAEKHKVKINCHGDCFSCRLCYTKGVKDIARELVKR